MCVRETSTCCFIINKYHSYSLSNLLPNHPIFRGGSRRVVESLDLWIHLEFQTSTSSEGTRTRAGEYGGVSPWPFRMLLLHRSHFNPSRDSGGLKGWNILGALTFSQVIQVYKVDGLSSFLSPLSLILSFFSQKRKLAKTCHRFSASGTSVRGNDASYLV